MINWDEVTVGETELVDKYGTRRLVLVIHGNMVGTKITNSPHYTDFGWWKKDDMADWTIYDPWEDVSDKISWDGNYVIHHKENVLSARDERYKTDGRRVWKRKEPTT